MFELWTVGQTKKRHLRHNLMATFHNFLYRQNYCLINKIISISIDNENNGCSSNTIESICGDLSLRKFWGQWHDFLQKVNNVSASKKQLKGRWIQVLPATHCSLQPVWNCNQLVSSPSHLVFLSTSPFLSSQLINTRPEQKTDTLSFSTSQKILLHLLKKSNLMLTDFLHPSRVKCLKPFSCNMLETPRKEQRQATKMQIYFRAME